VLLALVGEQRKAAKLFGIDLSEEMIKIARAKLGDKADLRVSDSERLPFEDEKFDLITCTFSFHHYPNPTAVLTEMKRVLSPNGKLIIADAVMFTPLRQLRNAIAAFAKEEKFYSKREISTLVKAAGLAISKWTRLDWLAYLMVAKKTGVV
jgi:ubiquinone/menaquinone biosynthesis C-methylase UbiE